MFLNISAFLIASELSISSGNPTDRRRGSAYLAHDETNDDTSTDIPIAYDSAETCKK